MAVINNLGTMQGGLDTTFDPKPGPPQDMVFRKQTGPEPFVIKRVWRGFWQTESGERMLPIRANGRSFGRSDGATFQPDENNIVWLPVTFIQEIKSYAYWNRDFPRYETKIINGQETQVEVPFTIGLEIVPEFLRGPQGEAPDQPPAQKEEEEPTWTAAQMSAAQLR